MRNFKKVMALAVSVAAICTSVSAFAAELDYKYYQGEVLSDLASYDADAHALTLNVETNGDATVLVLDNGVVDTAATGEDILYINQYTENDTAYASMKLKGTALEVGTYVVKYGYTDSEGGFAIANGQLKVTVKEDEGQKITIVYGDVTADGAADAQDAGAILATAIGGDLKVNEKAYEIGSSLDTIVYGDVTADGAADAQDAGAILATAIGGDLKVNEKAYEIGSNVTVTIK